MKVTVFHNPNCGTSRNVLGLLEQRGIQPEVIEYLKTPPSSERIAALAKKAGVGVRGLLREKGTPYEELGLGNPALTDDQLLDAIAKHPILLNRPIVETPLGTLLCRPSERVLEILPPSPEPSR
jgi:arsenate reductase